MGIEAKFDEFIAAVKENTAALLTVTANHERLLAGQAAAIDKIEAPKAKRETKAEKEAREKAEAADDAGNVASDPVPTASATPAATTVAEPTSDLPAVTDEQVKATAVAWMGTTEDVTEKTKRAKWLQELIGSFGVDDRDMKMLTGPDSKLNNDHRAKTVFFIKRAHKLGGIEHVDFAAPYDFSGAPDQDVPRVEAAAAVAEFDPLG